MYAQSLRIASRAVIEDVEGSVHCKISRACLFKPFCGLASINGSGGLHLCFVGDLVSSGDPVKNSSAFLFGSGTFGIMLALIQHHLIGCIKDLIDSLAESMLKW